MPDETPSDAQATAVAARWSVAAAALHPKLQAFAETLPPDEQALLVQLLSDGADQSDDTDMAGFGLFAASAPAVLATRAMWTGRQSQRLSAASAAFAPSGILPTIQPNRPCARARQLPQRVRNFQVVGRRDAPRVQILHREQASNQRDLAGTQVASSAGSRRRRD